MLIEAYPYPVGTKFECMTVPGLQQSTFSGNLFCCSVDSVHTVIGSSFVFSENNQVYTLSFISNETNYWLYSTSYKYLLYYADKLHRNEDILLSDFLAAFPEAVV